jgi:uncharacterized coiled-coil DUF342 family protein
MAEPTRHERNATTGTNGHHGGAASDEIDRLREQIRELTAELEAVRHDRDEYRRAAASLAAQSFPPLRAEEFEEIHRTGISFEQLLAELDRPAGGV